jgi:hypothetical protein
MRRMQEHQGSISVVCAAEIGGMKHLTAQLAAIISESYIDPLAILIPELKKCTDIYLYKDDAGQVLSFFMIARHELTTVEASVPAVYLGLSATNPQTKNSAIIRDLYRAFVRDAQGWERSSGQPLTLWYTTATPSACLAAYAIFAEAEPRQDGSFTDRRLAAVSAIRKALGLEGRPGEHPFVLPSLFGDVRYSETECARIAAICEKRQFSLLRDLGVDETRGDRLLYVCSVPSEPAAA